MLSESIPQLAGFAEAAASRNNSAAAERDLPFRGVFHPLGFAVEIRTNDATVLDIAAESWGHTRPRQVRATVQIRVDIGDSESSECPPVPDFHAQRHLITFIADTMNLATCDLIAGFGFARISRAALEHRLYFRYHFLESIAMILVSAIHAPPLHAACVSRHGRGMLLFGLSGAGKSTLAYACARAGFTYITDDGSYLIRDSDHPRVVGHSHKIRFRPSCREFFPELRDRELTPKLEGKPSIEIRTADLPGLITTPEARIDYLILLKREAGAVATLSPIPTPLALECFHDGLYPVEEIRRIHIAALEQLNDVAAFEFVYSDLDDAVRCLDALSRTPGQSI